MVFSCLSLPQDGTNFSYSFMSPTRKNTTYANSNKANVRLSLVSYTKTSYCWGPVRQETSLNHFFGSDSLCQQEEQACRAALQPRRCCCCGYCLACGLLCAEHRCKERVTGCPCIQSHTLFCSWNRRIILHEVKCNAKQQLNDSLKINSQSPDYSFKNVVLCATGLRC